MGGETKRGKDERVRPARKPVRRHGPDLRYESCVGLPQFVPICHPLVLMGTVNY